LLLVEVQNHTVPVRERGRIRVISVTLQPFYPWKTKLPHKHWIRCWVGPRAGNKQLYKRKPVRRKSNINFLVFPLCKIYPTSYSKLSAKITLIDTIMETLLIIKQIKTAVFSILLSNVTTI